MLPANEHHEGMIPWRDLPWHERIPWHGHSFARLACDGIAMCMHGDCTQASKFVQIVMRRKSGFLSGGPGAANYIANCVDRRNFVSSSSRRLGATDLKGMFVHRFNDVCVANSNAACTSLQVVDEDRVFVTVQEVCVGDEMTIYLTTNVAGIHECVSSFIVDEMMMATLLELIDPTGKLIYCCLHVGLADDCRCTVSATIASDAGLDCPLAR